MGIPAGAATDAAATTAGAGARASMEDASAGVGAAMDAGATGWTPKALTTPPSKVQGNSNINRWSGGPATFGFVIGPEERAGPLWRHSRSWHRQDHPCGSL